MNDVVRAPHSCIISGSSSTGSFPATGAASPYGTKDPFPCSISEPGSESGAIAVGVSGCDSGASSDGGAPLSDSGAAPSDWTTALSEGSGDVGGDGSENRSSGSGAEAGAAAAKGEVAPPFAPATADAGLAGIPGAAVGLAAGPTSDSAGPSAVAGDDCGGVGGGVGSRGITRGIFISSACVPRATESINVEKRRGPPSKSISACHNAASTSHHHSVLASTLLKQQGVSVSGCSCG